MITASDVFAINTGGIQYRDTIDAVTTEIRCTVVLDPGTPEKVSVDINVFNGTGNNIGGERRLFSFAEVDAFTPTGATSADDFYNQAEQAVKDYLEGLSENTGVTFTIA